MATTKRKAKATPVKQRQPAKRGSRGAPSLRGCPLNYEVEADAPDVRAALGRLRKADRALLRAAERHIARYCKDVLTHLDAGDRPAIELRRVGDVWKHVQLGFELGVSRRSRGDAEDGVYFSLECNCDWDVEHGLQLVIRDGRAVTKVGAFDGHVTNSDAYADRSLAGVVYVPM
ncbi:MAG TPA: hypothetical protein VGG74_29880 [Kofleriaceae bacterium]